MGAQCKDAVLQRTCTVCTDIQETNLGDDRQCAKCLSYKCRQCLKDFANLCKQMPAQVARSHKCINLQVSTSGKRFGAVGNCEKCHVKAWNLEIAKHCTELQRTCTVCTDIKETNLGFNSDRQCSKCVADYCSQCLQDFGNLFKQIDPDSIYGPAPAHVARTRKQLSKRNKRSITGNCEKCEAKIRQENAVGAKPFRVNVVDELKKFAGIRHKMKY